MGSDTLANDEVTLENLTERLIAFRDAREWRQFHSLKDLIVSLNLEASELLELKQWKGETEFDALGSDETVKPGFPRNAPTFCSTCF